MEPAAPLTCIVHTRDSARTLEKALASVAWADELLVVDMQSADATREIARRHGARVLEAEPVPRVDAVRNRFVAAAQHAWILVLDSDEYLEEGAEASVRALVSEAGDTVDAIAIPRFNHVGGRVLRGSGWYPDHQLRLFRKGAVEWSDSLHGGARHLTGRERLRELEPPGCLHIHHDNHVDLAGFASKQLAYALADRYDDDPERFRFDDYLALAYERLAERRDPEQDGDLGHALSLLFAWDAVVRGIVHWERLDPRPPLPDAVALPTAERDTRKEARRRRRDRLRRLRPWRRPGRSRS